MCLWQSMASSNHQMICDPHKTKNTKIRQRLCLKKFPSIGDWIMRFNLCLHFSFPPHGLVIGPGDKSRESLGGLAGVQSGYSTKKVRNQVNSVYNSVQFRRIANQDDAASKWFCRWWFQTGQIHDRTETYTVLISWDSPPRPKNSTSHLVKLKALGQAHYCIWPRKSIKECLLATSPAMVKLHGIWQMFH